MRVDRKYSVGVALLAVAAVVFGVTGTVAPSFEPISPQQSSSDSVVPYFITPPNFDSGWVDITCKCGQYLNVTHNLNTTKVLVDITGKLTLDDGEHKRYFGGTGCASGWNRKYGSASSLVQTSDGGYAVAGGGLVKTDICGNTLWAKTYDGSCNALTQTGDGGYALAGYTYTLEGNYDFWMVKTDSAGNAQWNRTYGHDEAWEILYAVIQTSDEGYALAGTLAGYHGSSAVLIKTNATGNMEWMNYYCEGGPRYRAHSLVCTNDGGYALAGWAELWTGLYGAYLIKTDATGGIEWEHVYDGTEWAMALVQTKDGGYALTAPDYVLSSTSWLLKIGSAGNLQWNKSYSYPSARALVQTKDDGYAMAGGSSYGWIVKTDLGGITQWNRTYGSPRSGSISAMVQTSDGGYTMGGTGDFWLVRTEVESGLALTDSTDKIVTLYRGKTDTYWNFVRVRVWTIEEPTWQYGDVNQDGVVDARDLYILSRNYGKTFSVASLGGIAVIAGACTCKKRKQAN